MSNKFFTRIKTCEVKYGNGEVVRYVIFSTINELFTGVVVYIRKQLNNGDINDGSTGEQHFPSLTEKEAIDECEKWIKDNIHDKISVTCTTP